tara:strand:+ start:49 stop:150 length:102 start_codon:yes stop_codon:yes gene_type:complete
MVGMKKRSKAMKNKKPKKKPMFQRKTGKVLRGK